MGSTLNYNLIFGDCLIELQKFNLTSIDLIVTDPPYGVSNNKTNIDFKGKRANLRQNFGEWDCFETEEKYITFSMQWLKLAWKILKPNRMLCMFWSNKKLSLAEELIRDSGFRLVDYFYKISSNPCPAFRKASFWSGVEPVLICQKIEGKPVTPPFNRDIVGCPNYVICGNVSKKQRVANHPTQKPLQPIIRLVKYWSKENEIVLDPFMGTATVGEACKELNRQFIGIEANKNYFEGAENRLNTITK